ncbi:uncharacterized protein E0L32_012180 [Thyridium curvatum]|uniref:Uncharacterized protein n=1 Tax=Thyridium curvatum TaxID=1093900 RepID=A0A507BJV9_9PEZI|nr:uncharacterized protein E0L32_012180 [Thyridium curvatum]TPX17351.1 hypothetical protein E0L32_012180 [Thyridium curvatum]
MAPLRRYLRITKYSVLECRIYLDNPALAQSWLLNPRDPVLPKVIESVRPLVLPKLREEKERAKKKGTKKKSIKDVVVQDDFEVAIFLTETNTRHSVLYKHKHFRDKTQTKLVSNSSKLTGATSDQPIDVEDRDLQIELQDESSGNVPVLLREDSDDDKPVALEDIPAIDELPPRSSRRRQRVEDSDDENGEGTGPVDLSSDDEYIDGDGDSDHQERPAKRRKEAAAVADSPEEQGDDKKKMAMDITYEGFAIYGRVLCLVVKRRDATGGTGTSASAGRRTKAAAAAAGAPRGQAMMENWISSTQMPANLAEEAEGS